MFSKTDTAPHNPYEAPLREGALTDKRRSILHDGLTITGDLHCDGVVEFSGTIIGDLSAETLVLTKTGKIQGNIRARSITLEGEVDGSIAGHSVAIKSFARINAHITAEVISVDPGATLNGKLSIKPNA